VRADRGRVVMAQPPSRPEARRRFGSQTVNELGAPVASSIPEQLPGREPAERDASWTYPTPRITDQV
jgi:hypothetical protein